MKIETVKQVEQTEVIDIELPYYYKISCSSVYCDSVIYGKIEENLYTTVQETEICDGRNKYEIERKEYDSIKDGGLSYYFGLAYKSSKEEFADVRGRCISLLNAVE